MSANPRMRVVCARCRRPHRVCYCAHVSVLPTRTRVLLLQHVRERRVGVGTARMAHLTLPNSALRAGVDFSRDPVVQAALAGSPPPQVLFPGPGARDVTEVDPASLTTLVVLDGTWWQARKLLKLNPALAALPRLAFAPQQPSDYRIRRQPAPFCLSTIEALAHVLTVLEPGEPRFHRLLDPFRAMVEQQERFETEVQAHRHRESRLAREARRAGGTGGGG